MKFYIVDAFTETLFGGNPAGVVILDAGQNFPEDEIMRKTAAELRYSETAFIKGVGNDEFNIRYFTPASEVDLCGHATVGSFCALTAAGVVKPGSSYINNTRAGRLNINVSQGCVLMDMGKAQALGKIDTAAALQELYGIMGLSYENQGTIVGSVGDDIGLLPELISTGLPDIMLPVCSEKELAAIHPDFPALSALSQHYGVVGVHAFTVNAADGAVHCRNFAPLYDIDEEAATGTSNGALTYYLYKNKLLSVGTENVFIQGEAMDRPSKITSRLTLCGDDIKIQVGGSAVVLAQGEIYL